MPTVQRKFVYRVSSGEIITESQETSADDSIFTPDALGQFALALITLDEAVLATSRPWFTDGTVARQATSQEQTAFLAAVIADDLEYDKFSLKMNSNERRVLRETIRLAVNENLPAAQQLNTAAMETLYDSAVDGLT